MTYGSVLSATVSLTLKTKRAASATTVTNCCAVSAAAAPVNGLQAILPSSGTRRTGVRGR